jgi:preprotein translocase subunit SecD
MKVFTFRIVIITAFVLLSVYLLYPTYVDHQNTVKLTEILEKARLNVQKNHPDWTPFQIEHRMKQIEDSVKGLDPSYASARAKRLKLGLDLQGGMRVVLEVNTVKLLEKVAKNPDNVFKQALTESEKEAAITDENVIDLFARKMKEKGVRLSRYYGTVRDDDKKIIDQLKKDSEDAVTRAMEIIRNRIDQYGVSEPSIQRQGARRIVIELPGVAREEEAKNLLQGTALLEFRLVKEPQQAVAIMQKVDDVLAGVNLSDTTNTDSSKANVKVAGKNRDSVDYNKLPENKRREVFEKNHPFFSLAFTQQNSTDLMVLEENKAKVQMLLNRPDVQAVLGDNAEFLFEAKPFTGEGGKKIYPLVLVNKKAELTGGVITNAQANIDQTTSGAVVSMEMNSEGSSEWARITGANINKRIAIVLDNLIFSAPNVKNKITGGRSQIDGMKNMEEAKLLEIVLKAGALPAPVNIIEERTVGPSLGQDSINSGLFSAFLGYLLIAVFMIFYYRRAGFVAAVSLIFVVFFLFGLMAGFKATLTLPGIAGIILTMAMAIDANVLIYERMREEFATGKTVKAVVEAGFGKAFSAIIDSNVTTFFTGIILYQFGTGPIQGFALTLMMGIVTSLFGTLVIARLIFDYMLYKGIKITVE